MVCPYSNKNENFYLFHNSFLPFKKIYVRDLSRSHNTPHSTHCGWTLSNLHDVSNRSSLDGLWMWRGEGASAVCWYRGPRTLPHANAVVNHSPLSRSAIVLVQAWGANKRFAFSLTILIGVFFIHFRAPRRGLEATRDEISIYFLSLNIRSGVPPWGANTVFTRIHNLSLS